MAVQVPQALVNRPMGIVGNGGEGKSLAKRRRQAQCTRRGGTMQERALEEGCREAAIRGKRGEGWQEGGGKLTAGRVQSVP